MSETCPELSTARLWAELGILFLSFLFLQSVNSLGRLIPGHQRQLHTPMRVRPRWIHSPSPCRLCL